MTHSLPESGTSAAVVSCAAITSLGTSEAEHLDALRLQPVIGHSNRWIPGELLKDKRISRRMRRAGRFEKLAALAAVNAIERAPASYDMTQSRTAVIVATAFGPHARTFAFLDGILDHGEEAALPTDFSHSVHNSAAAYVTELLQLTGHSLTLADFHEPLEQAVLAAQTWLAGDWCDQALVIAVDELGTILEKLTPELIPDSEVPLAEGAFAFLLSATEPTQGNSSFQLSCSPALPSSHQILAPAYPPLAPRTVSPNTFSYEPWFGRLAQPSAANLYARLVCQEDPQATPQPLVENEADSFSMRTTTIVRSNDRTSCAHELSLYPPVEGCPDA